MNKAQEKFISYLNEYYEDVRQSVQEYYEQICFEFESKNKIEDVVNQKFKDDPRMEYMTCVEEILKILTTSTEEWKKFKVCFVKFSDLSHLLLNSNLNKKEMHAIIELIIERNIEIFQNNQFSISCKDMRTLETKKMTMDEYYEFLYANEYLDLIITNDESLTPEEIDLKRKISYSLVGIKRDNEMKEIHEKIKNHCFDKRNSFTQEDMEVTIKQYKLLGVSDTLCICFQSLLTKDLERRNKNLAKISTKRIVEEKQEVKKTISNREYKKIFKQIEEYYNIQNQRAIKPLKLQEIIYLISLMYKIDIPEKEIKKCIQTIYATGYEAYNDTLVKFYDYYPKMVYYSENEDIKLALDTIVSYLKEIEEITNNTKIKEDYAFWEGEIKEEFNKVFPELNKDYNYELEEGRKIN